MRHASAVAACAIGACCGNAPAAPRAIGTMAREMLPPVARCLIQREPALVGSWLRTLPGSPEEARIVRRAEPRLPACFDPFVHTSRADWVPEYNVVSIRAGLVRALLQARRRGLPADPPAGTRPPWYSIPSDGRDARAAALAIVASDLGLCLARKHWRSVVAIVDTVDPETENLFFSSASPKAKAAREREAALVERELAKVIPSIAGCFPAGATLTIDRRRLRSLLEEAAYHLTEPDPAPRG
jgi:hypothetical protein